jgi:hypothetical protein
VLPFVLALAAAPPASAQSLSCYPIERGESAAELSRRITGNSWNAYQSWFQIVDASSRFVPKSQYDEIRPDWRACIVERPRRPRAVAVAARVVEAPPPVPEAAPTAAPVRDDNLLLLWVANARQLIRSAQVDPAKLWAQADPTKLWFGVTAILALVGWKAFDGYVGRRKTLVVVMNHFARRFVSEFERPLVQRPTEFPLRSQVRLSPARGRLEIRLAPGQGRRYPNLSDHRKNVEYDVVRILRSLADSSFVPEALYAQAGWVVVSFRFEVDRKRTGIPCISSF